MADPEPARYGWRDLLTDYGRAVTFWGIVSTMLTVILYLLNVLPVGVTVVLASFLGGCSFVALLGHLVVSNKEPPVTLGRISKERSKVTLPQADLPVIDAKIIEAFISPFHGGALCFVHLSLHNTTTVVCDVPRIGYSLALAIEGQQATFETAKTVEVFGNYYLSVFESEPQWEHFKELSRDVILLPPKGTLKRGKPVFGWLGFEIRGLPPWPEYREPSGMHEEETLDEDGQWIGVEEVVEFDVFLKTDGVQAVTLTVTDPFGREHHATKDAPLHEKGRGVFKETKH